MSEQQAIRIACRVVCVYLICWAISDLLSMPREVVAIMRSWHLIQHSVISPSLPDPTDAYRLTILRMDLGFLASNILRFFVWLFVALWFYRAGPRLQSFFGAREISREDPAA